MGFQLPTSTGEFAGFLNHQQYRSYPHLVNLRSTRGRLGDLPCHRHGSVAAWPCAAPSRAMRRIAADGCVRREGNKPKWKRSKGDARRGTETFLPTIVVYQLDMMIMYVIFHGMKTRMFFMGTEKSRLTLDLFSWLCTFLTDSDPMGFITRWWFQICLN